MFYWETALPETASRPVVRGFIFCVVEFATDCGVPPLVELGQHTVRGVHLDRHACDFLPPPQSLDRDAHRGELSSPSVQSRRSQGVALFVLFHMGSWPLVHLGVYS